MCQLKHTTSFQVREAGAQIYTPRKGRDTTIRLSLREPLHMTEPDRLSANAPSLPVISCPTSLEESIFGHRAHRDIAADGETEGSCLRRVSLDQREAGEAILLRQTVPYPSTKAQLETTTSHEASKEGHYSQTSRPTGESRHGSSVSGYGNCLHAY